MLNVLLSEVVLRKVPEHLLAGRLSGDIELYGSILRSISSGRIVGHLQETSVLGNLTSRIMSIPSYVPGIGTLANGLGQITTIAQNEQIKAGIGLLKSMQLTNLAVSTAGLGISLAGFAILSAKIDKLALKIQDQSEQLDKLAKGVEFLKQDRIAEDFTRLRSMLHELDETWLLSAPAAQLQHVGQESIYLMEQFERRITSMQDEGAELATIEPFLEGFAMAHTARVQARLAGNEDRAARKAAETGAKKLASFGDQNRLSDMVLARMSRVTSRAGSTDWADQLEVETAKAGRLVAAARAREANAISTCFTLEDLSRRKISGREWLEMARAETDAPVLFLPSLK